jgi:hypothetical protein
MSSYIPVVTPDTDSNAAAPERFTPSVSALLEHSARQHADEVIDQFVERFTEKDFIPEDGDSLLFAMLTCLPKWPEDTQISILDDDGSEVACYLKGNDESIIRHTVALVQRDDGAYARKHGLPASAEEPLLRLIFDQLPDSSDLGYDDEESLVTNLIVEPVVMIREQVARLARAERALLFDALLAEVGTVKRERPNDRPNPFLPTRIVSAQEVSPVLSTLLALNPAVSVVRLADLLRNMPLTPAQEADFLQNGTLPKDFACALAISLAEQARDRAIDGVFHTRTFDPDTDTLARQLAGRLLKDQLGRELVIVEPDSAQYSPERPDENPVVLQYRGDGEYRAQDGRNGNVGAYGSGSDSFYLAICTLLQPAERTMLGLQSEHDGAGFRKVVARLAVEDNGGWFAPQDPSGASAECVPGWFRQASRTDKYRWRTAVQVYHQALIDAQTPGFPDITTFGEPEKLRQYAIEKLRERLSVDLGLDLDPDEILIETFRVTSTDNPAPGSRFGAVYPLERPEVISGSQVCSLTDLSLKNVSYTDLPFRFASHAFDAHNNPVNALTADYVYGLVRDLDVGNGYSNFLKTRLITSPQGLWYRERYAQVMQAQMRLDALEARIAGDYLEEGESTTGQQDRIYNWVTAVLDHPVDDDHRARVDGDRIQVQQLFINGHRLDGLLIIAPSELHASRFLLCTPLAPDGKYFRVLNSLIEVRTLLRSSGDWQSYALNLAAPKDRPGVRYALVTRLSPTMGVGDQMKLDLVPCAGNFLESAYDAQVERVLAAVDEQTISTSERNWESAWEIADVLTDIALTFLPFKVALPIAAFRSIFALSQSVRGAFNGDSATGRHWVEAAGFLAYGLGGPKGPRLRPRNARPAASIFDPKKVLLKAPDGLRLRTDGRYNGVYEDIGGIGDPSRFYVKLADDIHEVVFDQGHDTWRRVDPARRNAIHQPPVFFEGGEWQEGLQNGLKGGGKPTNLKKAPRKERPGTSSAATATPAADEGPKRYRLEMNGLEQDKIFKKTDRHIQDRLRESIAEVMDDYERRGGGKFHGYTPKGASEKIFTLDLTGMPNSTGRGAWRLQFKEKWVQKMEEGEPVYRVNKKTGEREPVMEVEKGVLEFDKVLSSH